MSSICNQCGLPQELCVCETIAKETQTVKVYLIKKKFGKKYTVIDGIDKNEINVKDLTKQLKAKLACGGTAKDKTIELQGDHRARVKTFLGEIGFSPETIEIQ